MARPRNVWSSALSGLFCLALVIWFAAPLPASAAPEPAAGSFDPVAATDAYLARLSPAARERSDSYFEGGYWIQLWSFLWGLAVAWFLLSRGRSVRFRDFAERAGRWPWLRRVIYAAGYLLATSLLGSPLAVYTDFFREHQYGLATQSFPGWLRDQLVGLGLGLVFGSVAISVLYAVLRRAGRAWWLWATAVMLVFLVIVALIAPVFINPLFNTYTRLDRPEIREPILALARANGVPAHDVWVSDASRQSKRVSANVSGLLGTERITLNDNLLNRCSLAEIEAVMGHELGHYVLNHVYELVFNFGLVIAGGFAFIAFSFEWARLKFGARWGVQGIADIAGLPLLAALFSVYFLVMTPVTNTIIRTNEAEADIFGLNASRQPDGFAEAALKLGEYRKLAPGPLEEFVFFDHPSGRQRILAAMRWKAEHLGELEAPKP